MRALAAITDEHIFRTELYQRAATMHDQLNELLEKAVAEGLPAFFIEALKAANAYGPSVLLGLDRLRRQAAKDAPAVRQEMRPADEQAEAVRRRKPYPRWMIQWHLGTTAYDTCEHCLSDEIRFFKNRKDHRICLNCRHKYHLGKPLRQWRKSILKKHKPPSEQVTPCSFPGCHDDCYARGWCFRHWRQWHNNPRQMKPLPPAGQCSAAGCSRTVLTKGLCRRHYRQVQTQGVITYGPRMKDIGLLCKTGCGEKAATKGYCPRHYDQVQRYGVVTVP